MLLYFASIASAVTPVPAATISIADPRSMVSFLQAQGYQATLDLTGKSPAIKSGVSGWKYSMVFHGCTEGKDCKDLLLYAGWDPAKGNETSVEKINEFNRDSRFARAYLDDEKDPVLEMDLVFTGHEMSEAMLKENLEIWSSVVSRFAKHVGME